MAMLAIGASTLMISGSRLDPMFWMVFREAVSLLILAREELSSVNTIHQSLDEHEQNKENGLAE